MTGDELRALRQRLRWSQERLAREVGVSLAAVWRWEAGQRAISEPIRRLVLLIVEREHKGRPTTRRRRR